MKKAFVLIVALAALLSLPQAAGAELPSHSVRYLDNGVQRITYRIGPIDVTSGQNRIAFKPVTGAEKPAVDGWILRLKPDLVYEDGSIPLSSKVMFHHGVWLNFSRQDATGGGPERFYATGEEKTITAFPKGYGYQYKRSDIWVLNHMIHNLVPEPMKLYATYEIDFIPADSPAAASIKPVTPIWMDVENGSGQYPVFDTWRGSGGKDGKFTYPDDADNAYPSGNARNRWTSNRDGVLLATAGHVHTGGLYTDLYLQRPGAKYQGPKCPLPPPIGINLPNPKKLKGKAKKRAQKAIRKHKASVRKHRACARKQPRVEGSKVHLYRSKAHYFGNRKPISWDMAMFATGPNWRVEVKKGDVLSTTATYETKIASWPESMGIMVVYMAENERGPNPYRKRVNYPGKLNHGHYVENRDHGGGLPLAGRNPTRLPDGAPQGANPFMISDYLYHGADFRMPGVAGRPPVVEEGKSLRFKVSDSDVSKEMWHSLTSCKAPCNRSTGISYPIPDGEFQFESGQLGVGGPPTVERTTWSTPSDLPRGTYTFFCRVHPLMRGAFRVK